MMPEITEIEEIVYSNTSRAEEHRLNGHTVKSFLSLSNAREGLRPYLDSNNKQVRELARECMTQILIVQIREYGFPLDFPLKDTQEAIL